jgi:hypothetical protein
MLGLTAPEHRDRSEEAAKSDRNTSMPDPFSAAQIVGYVAFVLGITSFLQKHDRPLVAFNALQSCAYAIHFAMLGNAAAASTSGISTVRSLLALRTRSRWIAAVIIVANFAGGFLVGAEGAGWIPPFAGAAATVALFMTRGLAMRLILFGCTCAWLVNNWLSASIGGVALETMMAVINLSTMFRILRDRRPSSGAEPPAG